MHLSRVAIENFRNFSDFEVSLCGNVVVVGENKVGKTNFLYALRLIFDAGLPDSSRQLRRSDFWDGLGELDEDTVIRVVVDIQDFESDLDTLALLTSFRVKGDPSTVRLNYEFRPKKGLTGSPTADDDYEFVCFGGDNESQNFGYALRSRLPLDLMHALRDAESDLANWRKSPLRPLISDVMSGQPADELKAIADAIALATKQLADLDDVGELGDSIKASLVAMAGKKQDVNPKLGFTPVDPTRFYRSIQLLIDGGKRGISEASLGSANLIFLSLKTLEISSLIAKNSRDHTFLAIEEPEAHLHPHLQRSVYKHFFETLFQGGGDQTGFSVLLTTHSPHIASVAPLRSILLLKESKDDGTKGRSTANINFLDDEIADLTRYLDVNRAELLFARGVILVEGDAERFIIPAFANRMGISLDQLGISICSVAGTNFVPYAKLLTGLKIPFVVITDWDPTDDEPLGWNRTLSIVRSIVTTATGKSNKALLEELDKITDPNDFCSRCEKYGIFSNVHTLEVDLYGEKNLVGALSRTLREGGFGAKRVARIDGWEKDPKTLDATQYLALIDEIGKGRFAQRLAANLPPKAVPPRYIGDAIKMLIANV